MTKPRTDAAESVALYGAALSKLAAHGIHPTPDAALTIRSLPEGTAPCVVLDRVGEVEPDYCIHGYTECVGCTAMLYLGSETHEAVAAGRVQPICSPCVQRLAPPGARPVGRIEDHR